MNSTKESTHHGNKVTIGDYEYGMGVSFGAVLMFTIITYALWKCIIHRSAAHRNFIEAAGTATATITTISEGFDESTLLTIPKLLYSETNKPDHKEDPIASGCSICLDDYKDSHLLRQLPYCGHFFHVECIDPWLRLHATCPICRDSPLCSKGIDQLVTQ